MSGHPFDEVTLPDGKKAFVFSQVQLLILGEIIDEHVWRRGTWLRIQRLSKYTAILVSALVALAFWWPQVEMTLDLFFTLIRGGS